MDALRHALLARRLLAACGGASVAASICRLSRSRLFDFQALADCGDPRLGRYMPIDVIVELEAYCGEPIYSAAVAAERPAAAQTADLLTEACEISEASGALLRVVRMATSDRVLTLRERRMIEAGAQAIEDEIRALREAASPGAALRASALRGTPR